MNKQTNKQVFFSARTTKREGGLTTLTTKQKKLRKKYEPLRSRGGTHLSGPTTKKNLCVSSLTHVLDY